MLVIFVLARRVCIFIAFLDRSVIELAISLFVINTLKIFSDLHWRCFGGYQPVQTYEHIWEKGRNDHIISFLFLGSGL